jgi:hypothetical protein
MAKPNATWAGLAMIFLGVALSSYALLDFDPAMAGGDFGAVGLRYSRGVRLRFPAGAILIIAGSLSYRRFVK